MTLTLTLTTHPVPMTTTPKTCDHCGCAPAVRDLRTLDPVTCYCVTERVCEACYLPAALAERDAEAAAAASLVDPEIGPDCDLS